MHNLGSEGMKAIQLFNERKYLESHYIFEKLWVESNGEKKIFLQGIIMIISAVIKIKIQHNWESAKRMLQKGSARLEIVDPENVKLDIRRLQNDATRLFAKLEELGPESFKNVAEEELPTLRTKK